MENLKILVENEAESKEAQELFFELGYQWAYRNIGKNIFYKKENIFLYADKSGNLGTGTKENKTHFNGWFGTFVSLPELRDLVVLKRNDVGDATHWHMTGKANLPYLFLSKEWYFFGRNGWEKSIHSQDFYNRLKPIEKPMKEYLRKNSNGTYSYIGTVRPEHVSDFMIEIPEGCNIITCENRKGNLVYFHWKSLDSDEFFLKDEKIWSNNFNETLSDFIEKNEGDVVIIWSRHTLPEQLPFIDDESYNPDYDGSEKEELESLNDQYAEIEKVRQSAWQKQEGGSHYKNLKIQPMQYALENKLDYAQANVVKYVTRHKKKNGKEDLLKAIHNIELMIEFYYGDEK